MQIAILLFNNGLTIYDLRVPTNTLNFAITFYRKSYILFISETVIALKSAFTSTFPTYDLYSETVASSLKERKKKKNLNLKTCTCLCNIYTLPTFVWHFLSIHIKGRLDMIFSRFPSVNKYCIFSQQSK